MKNLKELLVQIRSRAPRLSVAASRSRSRGLGFEPLESRLALSAAPAAHFEFEVIEIERYWVVGPFQYAQIEVLNVAVQPSKTYGGPTDFLLPSKYGDLDQGMLSPGDHDHDGHDSFGGPDQQWLGGGSFPGSNNGSPQFLQDNATQDVAGTNSSNSLNPGQSNIVFAGFVPSQVEPPEFAKEVGPLGPALNDNLGVGNLVSPSAPTLSLTLSTFDSNASKESVSDDFFAEFAQAETETASWKTFKTAPKSQNLRSPEIASLLEESEFASPVQQDSLDRDGVALGTLEVELQAIDRVLSTLHDIRPAESRTPKEDQTPASTQENRSDPDSTSPQPTAADSQSIVPLSLVDVEGGMVWLATDQTQQSVDAPLAAMVAQSVVGPQASPGGLEISIGMYQAVEVGVSGSTPATASSSAATSQLPPPAASRGAEHSAPSGDNAS